MRSGQRRWGQLGTSHGQVVAVKRLRDQLVRPGDVRNEVGFQNDINILLATLECGDMVWASEGPLLSPDSRVEDAAITLTELECIAETTGSEMWAVSTLLPASRAA